MQEFIIILNLQIQMILLAATGFILARLGIMQKEVRQGIVNICFYVVVPCNIVRSFEVEFSGEMVRNMVTILIIAAGVQLFGLLLCKILYRKKEDGKRRILSYGTMISNQGFMGLPVINSLLGSTGFMYASIALIPYRVVMWTIAFAQFSGSCGRKTVLKMIIHPCMIAVFIGLAILIGGIKLPYVIDSTLASVGGCVLPLVMISIGSIFVDVKFKELISKEVIQFTFVRLLLIPGIVLLSMKLLHVDEVIAAVTVIFAAMPAAIVTAVLAEQFGYDSVFASNCVMATTLLSIGTITFWLLFI